MISKILKISSKIRKKVMYGTYDSFSKIMIEVTNVCNRKCSYCPSSYKEFKEKIGFRNMEFDLFKKIIDELKEMNFKGQVELNVGGEPLLVKTLPNFVEYARINLNKKVKIWLCTNGDFINKENFEELIQKGLDFIRITQHGKVISENLKNFFNEIGGQKKRVIIFEVLTEESSLWNAMGFLKLKNTHYPNKNCRIPLNVLVVKADGKVGLCCIDWFNEGLQGDLTKQSIREVWNDPINRRRREEIAEGKLNKYDYCRRCVGISKTV